MKKLLSLVAFCLPFTLIAQNDESTGIRFENFPNWTAVKEKAKQENKYIFVDCYATWCGPCKKMDKEVYTIDSIGKLFDGNFISIKIQSDTSRNDNDDVKRWYADAKYFQSEYKIASLPTFLFFSPDGKLVHEGVGYMSPTRFYALGKDAQNPQTQYYSMVRRYKQGGMSYPEIFILGCMASANGDQGMGDTLLRQYTNEYLLKLDDSALFSNKSLSIIGGTILSSKDKGFKLFYDNVARIDAIMKDSNFTSSILDRIIEYEEIFNRLYTPVPPYTPLTDNPDWDGIFRKIKHKYNATYADRVTLWAKIKWFAYKKDWPAYSKCVIRRVETYGPYVNLFPYTYSHGNMYVNSSAWEVFTYSMDTNDLKKALEWSRRTLIDTASSEVHLQAACFDTYANLLYKLGRKEEALGYEQKALTLSPKKTTYQETLDKIKKGEPTWPKL